MKMDDKKPVEQKKYTIKLLCPSETIEVWADGQGEAMKATRKKYGSRSMAVTGVSRKGKGKG